MNPFTATLSIRFVVALYSVLRIVSSDEAPDETAENDRRTRGESSWSTRKVWSVADARRAVGRGISIVLECRLGQPQVRQQENQHTVSMETQDLVK